MTTTLEHRPAPEPTSEAGTERGTERAIERISARFGLAFAFSQLAVMVAMAIFVLPKSGALDDPAGVRGQNILDAETVFRVANYAFALAGMLLLGFLGVVHLRLRRADRSGVLASVALASGVLLSLIWPFSAVLHDVALDAGAAGADLRILGAWDAIAPYSLAFSALPRIFFVGSIVLGLRLTGTAPRLQRLGLVLVPLTLLGSATLISSAFFPLLALSTLAYELWVGALAWQWLRRP